VRFDPARASIWLAGIPVFRHGVPLPFDERRAHRAMLAKQFSIVLDLGIRAKGNWKLGNGKWGKSSLTPGRQLALSKAEGSPGTARFWTCDFTGDYVTVNASYRT
jgi:N-acetylglutamate synthase/N-acetylornithine aminotransferase